MLEELESKLNEAHQTLIELNGEYNDLLTVEHEEAMKKSSRMGKNLSWNDLVSEANKKTMDPQEKAALARADLFYSIRMFISLILGLARIIPFFLAFSLVALNAMYTGRKKSKIKNKYEPKDEPKKENNVPKREPTRKYSKAEKEDLYERVCEARFNYHNLRKEYERQQNNLALNRELENTQDAQEDNQKTLFQIYEAYIDYIKNPRLGEEQGVNDNNAKLYELRLWDDK